MTTRTRDYLLRKLGRRSRGTARQRDVEGVRRLLGGFMEDLFDALYEESADIQSRMDRSRETLDQEIHDKARIAAREVDRLRIHLRNRLDSIEAILRPMAIQYRAFDELTRAARQPGRMPTLGEVIGSDLDKHQFDPIVAAQEIQDAYQGPGVPGSNLGGTEGDDGR